MDVYRLAITSLKNETKRNIYTIWLKEINKQLINVNKNFKYNFCSHIIQKHRNKCKFKSSNKIYNLISKYIESLLSNNLTNKNSSLTKLLILRNQMTQDELLLFNCFYNGECPFWSYTFSTNFDQIYGLNLQFRARKYKNV